MLQGLYKALYTRIGGRPWTYITRDATRKRPLEWLLLFFLLGNLVGNVFQWRTELLVLGTVAVGIVIGHIWWGGRRTR